MDEVLLKQLVRQMRVLNIWIGFFGVLFIITMVIMGILLFKIVTTLNHAERSIQNFQDKTSNTLNVEDKACNNDSLKSALQKAGYCK